MTDAALSTPAPSAQPYWISLLLIPVVLTATYAGGWAILLVPVSTWVLFAVLDAVMGANTGSPSIDTPDEALYWHRVLTIIWAPIQGATIFGVLWYLATTEYHSVGEELGIAFGLGVLAGTVGIVYAHELLHRSPRIEREMADILLAMVLYSHFRSEHLLVHHRYVGTPKDTVTARYNEGFHRFFARVLRDGLPSAWRAEALRLRRKGKPVWSRENPFWKYAALQLVFVGIAFLLGGLWGLVLFGTMAFVAIWQLELVNYVEHYGLTRRYLGDGRYEPAGKHHSWNSDMSMTNALLLNLQRHSDHHTSPGRRFPLLQSTSPEDAPTLPHGYPVMTTMAMIPPLWRRRMNPRVREWRRRYYPDITDWSAYKAMSHPMPK